MPWITPYIYGILEEKTMRRLWIGQCSSMIHNIQVATTVIKLRRNNINPYKPPNNKILNTSMNGRRNPKKPSPDRFDTSVSKGPAICSPDSICRYNLNALMRELCIKLLPVFPFPLSWLVFFRLLCFLVCLKYDFSMNRQKLFFLCLKKMCSANHFGV